MGCVRFGWGRVVCRGGGAGIFLGGFILLEVVDFLFFLFVSFFLWFKWVEAVQPLRFKLSASFCFESLSLGFYRRTVPYCLQALVTG